MWDDEDYQFFDAHERVPRLDVPAYFFNGAKDYDTPLAVTRDYVDALEAPEGKELVIFESSAHTPFLAEPEKFERELVRVKEETWRSGGGRHGGTVLGGTDADGEEPDGGGAS